MKKFKQIIFFSILAIIIFPGCTKYGKGFLSPYLQYAVNQITITRGRIVSSYSLNTDGSDIPLTVKWTHIYDASGNIVDSLFKKEYPVAVWTSVYDPNVDKTYAAIMAKRTIKNLPPITVNEHNGTIEANPATIYLPLGTYTMDIEVSNSAGTQKLKNIMKIVIQDGKQLETAPEQGSFANGRALAGTAPVTYFFNGANNPFDVYDIVRIADTPNVLILKFTDRNGVPFNPKTGEVIKRPNTGLNPNPPFLQNLQDYAPDTYVVTDTAISIKYPLTPFPINSLGNGYNLYYNVNTAAVRIDSTSAWSSNAAGNYYKGTADSHYLGVYNDGRYDYSVRVPMRIFVPGSYEFTVKLLNTTHR